MAEELFQFAIPTPPVKAAVDLRAYQYKAVWFNADGVFPATADPTSGPAYILANKPNSGQACTVVGLGNMTKAVAGATITPNIPISFTNSGVMTPASYAYYATSGAILTLGWSYSGCTSGSLFNLYVR